MTAEQIARNLGRARRSGQWWSCCCPTHDDWSPSLSLRDGDCGLAIHCWADCESREVLAELHRRGLISGTETSTSEPVRTRHYGAKNSTDDAAQRIATARRIWDSAREALGTPVVVYMRARGVTIAPPSSLRWTPALRRLDSTYGPAMVARIDGVDGKLIGIVRTWLARDGAGQWRRRDRAMLGRSAGGAVRLAEAGETLMVAEGIETAMAAISATAQPAWAALSTTGITSLIIPPIVTTVIILADHDRSGAGERAARKAAAQWVAEGRRVRVAMPPRPGDDFNDVLAETRDVAA